MVGYLYWNDGSWVTSAAGVTSTCSTFDRDDGYRIYNGPVEYAGELQEEVKVVRRGIVHPEVPRVVGSPCKGFKGKIRTKIRNRI